jgi:hypothetical protein
MGRLFVTEEEILELVHACIGEKQGRIIFDNDGSGRHDGMPFRFEKIQKMLAYG